MLLVLNSGASLTDFLLALPILIPVLLPMLVFHEVSHGWVAYRLGDNTAKQMGRLSLNPLPHIDAGGAIAFLLIGIGWAKPVPVNPYRLRMDPRKGMAIVAAAGPITNLTMAAIFAIPFRLDWISADNPLESSSLLTMFFALIVLFNLILAIFNLLPVPPFDGYRIVVGILPRQWASPVANLEKYAPLIIVGFLILVFYTGLISSVIDSAVNFFSNAFMGQQLS
ncbi:MAG: site-2 protease family protein [Dehalococcoidia bacterium]|nr:site-2 protease family protein [Dehalococcoidia bacterium]